MPQLVTPRPAASVVPADMLLLCAGRIEEWNRVSRDLALTNVIPCSIKSLNSMLLARGDRLGPYEIVAAIGAGGMGEVYRARDPRMGREVALKVSAERFSDRFEHEVRAVASLNHPIICHIYDVGPNYLVMELVEAPTLADRIKEGPLSLEEALVIARQIAEALEAAHDSAICSGTASGPAARVAIWAPGRWA